jgi:rare lipoprotein A
MFEMRAKMISVGLLGAATMLPIDYAKADQLGHASWYSLPSNITANGEQMNPNELTAAHRSLPFGTKVLVENLTNGRSVVVRINDRGPFIGGRIIDLSRAAATSIGMIDAGTAKVRVTTAGDSALAALAESAIKAKTGAASAAAAEVDIAAKETPKAMATASNASRSRSVAAKAAVGGEIRRQEV